MSDAIEPTNVQSGSEVAANSGSNLPATTDNAPKPTFGGLINGIINFLTLTARFVALAAAALLLKEQLHLLKARMRSDAAFARKVAELCGQAGVDAYFLGLFFETANAFDRVAEASGELANAADQMEADARGVHAAHEAEYRGIYEAVQASPYRQPKPGFNKVR
ncbi:conjugal transfer protein TraB [Streptomyces cylindrosporus]|uniref:Conjugal transfer protein TraB n=1 Tax=Streptomyces cylindrosporus TaxID=2927583 RepID=A0ABS9YPE1_9ACTN|nr:conjugal transfer protein TraB [Streptomyces cylindrosporus]MCI3279109.1 conjugal transfer protein TraB [Streptomyces cylindrosporus]